MWGEPPPPTNRSCVLMPCCLQGAIKDVHLAAVNGDAEAFQRRTEEPVPVEILTSRDSSGLTPLHKVPTHAQRGGAGC